MTSTIASTGTTNGVNPLDVVLVFGRHGDELFQCRKRPDEAVEKGDDETALRLAQKLSDPRCQTPVFLRVARRFEEKKEPQRAVEVLRRAAQVVADDTNERGRAQALLALANAATSLDASYGFELMESAVAAFNRAEAGKKQEDESNLDSREFEQGLAALAGTDFDRARQLARAIECREASLVAQLAVCAARLSK